MMMMTCLILWMPEFAFVLETAGSSVPPVMAMNSGVADVGVVPSAEAAAGMDTSAREKKNDRQRLRLDPCNDIDMLQEEVSLPVPPRMRFQRFWRRYSKTACLGQAAVPGK